MEYVIVAIVCFGLGILYMYEPGYKKKLDTHVMSLLKQGKRVMIIVDDEATIFEMFGDRIRITKALTSYNVESVDDDGGVVPYDLVSGVANEPLDNSKTSVPDEEKH